MAKTEQEFSEALNARTYENVGERRAVQKWHAGKEVPIATLAAIILQTAGVIWWAASTSAKVEFLKESIISAQVVQTSIDRKQDDEGQRAESRVIVRLDKLDTKLDALITKTSGK